MLAIDVGNTKTAIGFFRDGVLSDRWQIKTDELRCTDEYRHLFGSYLATVGETLQSTGCAILSSVVPRVTEELMNLRSDFDLHQVTYKSPVSFEITLPEPRTLGGDRVADLEAALRKYGAPVVVVDAGTATTLSAINSKKQLVGGAIAPGLGISLDALYDRAALLAPSPLPVVERVIGNTTEKAIASGAGFGHAMMIRGLLRRMAEELETEDLTVVATGGSIEQLLPYLDPHITVDPRLTLDGLNFIHRNLHVA